MHKKHKTAKLEGHKLKAKQPRRIEMGQASLKPLYLVLLTLSILVLVIALVIKFFILPSSKLITTPSVQVTPTPTKSNKTLPSGGQIYRFSHGKEVIGPKIQTVNISNLTPSLKETQSITVVIANDSPVTDAQVTVSMDEKKITYPLRLTQGTTTEGTWVASWNVSGTYDYQYSMNFDLKSSTGNYLGGLNFR